MKSYRRNPFLPTLLLLALAVPAAARAEGFLLDRLNSEREAAGVPRLAADARLEAAAGVYAGRLLAWGRLSHRDPEGGNALGRYRAEGGTSLRVGEVLGAGPALEAVWEAWLASPSHRRVLFDPEWTHVGYGRVGREGTSVWVVLFTRRGVEHLTLAPVEGGGWSLSGFLRPGARVPVLYSGPRFLEPTEWETGSGWFRYHLPPEAGPRYHRLGYETLSGEVKITDTFFPDRLPGAGGATFSPGRVSPEG